MKTVEKWDVLELSFDGKKDGNPFVDYNISGEFVSKNERKTVDGFYDGDGKYIVRFMPSFEEKYDYEVKGTFSNEVFTGEFIATEPSENNHGVLRTVKTFHFAYDDATPYYPVGTTCYVWTHQDDDVIEKTIKTLKEGYFNKIRFCIFPKHYDYNFRDPALFPYEGTPCDNSTLNKGNYWNFFRENKEKNNWDFTKFNPEYFRKFEKYLGVLKDLNIEADIIVMHPYDRWGFSEMSKEEDDLYWNYILARLSSYRNVWWSLANEYDLMPTKKLEDWERFAKIICEKDPYNHLRSIHNCFDFYDFTRSWVTHCSIQRTDLYKCAENVDEYRVRYNKPVVLDEIAYEGDIQFGWGNISAQEIVRRFWEASMRGGYATHGETYLPEDEINGLLWWSHGGELLGQSPERIKFLHKILSETPGYGLKRIGTAWDEISACATDDSEYRISYYSFFRPKFRDFSKNDPNSKYEVDVIDTWNMTVEKVGVFQGDFRVKLPGREFMAIRIKKI